MSSGDDEGIAPVIPLFGSPAERRGEVEGGGVPSPAPRRFPVRRVPSERAAPARGGESDESAGSQGAGRGDEAAATGAEDWHTTWRGLGGGDRPRPAPRLDTVERDGVTFVELPGGAGEPDGAEPELDELAEKAERKLLRSLGSRGLSVSEARAKLRQQGLPAEAVDDIVERLERAGALDDDVLAEQIVFQASAHRGEGRKAIAQSLTRRGIGRDTIDRVVSELPDDDYERAMEFARNRARQLARYDDDTALRRLVGQLSRRGYGGLAMSVARRALDEQSAPSRRVRFE